LKTEQYRSQHDRLLQLAETILNGLMAQPFDAPAVRSSLSRLAGVLKIHLAVEDEVLYPTLGENPDPTVRETARQFADEMGSLAAVFTEYNSRWTIESMEADTAEFAKETRGVFSALAQRIERENRILYPMLEGRSLTAA
jgi:hypothetical protein